MDALGFQVVERLAALETQVKILAEEVRLLRLNHRNGRSTLPISGGVGGSVAFGLFLIARAMGLV